MDGIIYELSLNDNDVTFKSLEKEIYKITCETACGVMAKIINGDGASWIKQGIDEENTYFQLDPFHKSQEEFKKVSNKKEAYKLIRMLNSEKSS